MPRELFQTSRKRTTIKDVAQSAGVHVSTVSRALDPNSKTPLTGEVAKRVKQAAAELGYRPNRIAAGLRTNRSMSIGVMIPDITNTIFPPIVRGIESVLEPQGYATILCNTDNQREREIRLIEALKQHGIDGMISVAAHRTDPEILALTEFGIPVITLNRRLDRSPVPYVEHDEEVGIHMILQHVFDLGHRKLGHIAGPDDLSTGQVRSDAYVAGCRTLDLPDSAGVLISAAQYDESEGERCAVELLDAHPGTTALICANDRLAIGAYAGLRSMGKRVPEDVSVTGFNDSPMLELIPPRVTTIRVEKFEAGRIGAEILLAAIRGEQKLPVGTILPVELVEGDSTSAPPTT